MKNVLIAGATGNFGGLLVENLVKKPGVNLFALVRDAASQKAANLSRQGVTLIEADLLNKPQLEKATQKMDIIISALSGGPEVVLDGQINLVEAAAKNGVSRFVPSDYSVDYFKLNYGDNVNLDMRKSVFEAIENSGIGYTILLCGAFMEVFAGPFFNVIDFEKKAVNFWGNGSQIFDLTTMPDTAKYLADMVFDDATLNKIVHIAGSEINMNAVVDLLSNHHNHHFEKTINGTNEELHQLIEDIKARDPYNVFAYVFYQYKLPMFNGVGKLTQPINKHYDGTPFTDLEHFIAHQAQQYQYQASF